MTTGLIELWTSVADQLTPSGGVCCCSPGHLSEAVAAVTSAGWPPEVTQRQPVSRDAAPLEVRLTESSDRLRCRRLRRDRGQDATDVRAELPRPRFVADGTAPMTYQENTKTSMSIDYSGLAEPVRELCRNVFVEMSSLCKLLAFCTRLKVRAEHGLCLTTARVCPQGMEIKLHPRCLYS